MTKIPEITDISALREMRASLITIEHEQRETLTDAQRNGMARQIAQIDLRIAELIDADMRAEGYETGMQTRAATIDGIVTLPPAGIDYETIGDAKLCRKYNTQL